MWLALRTLDPPLWAWWDADATLVCLRMDILRCWGIVLISASTSTTSEKLETGFDVGVCRIQFGRAGVGIKRISSLIVAGLILVWVSTSRSLYKTEEQTHQCAKVVPDLRDIGIQANGSGICIEGVTILVDLVVQDSDGAPECRISSIAVDSLLVGLVSLWELLLCHVAASEQVPALSVLVVWGNVSTKLVGCEFYLPELTDCSRYSIACCWLLYELLC